MTNELLARIELLEEENQELKKQLEISETNEETYYLEIKGIAEALELNENSIVEDIYQKISGLKNQQKEFIEYLETCINKTDYEVNVLGNYKYLAWSNAYKSALTKYKKITGVKDEEI